MAGLWISFVLIVVLLWVVVNRSDVKYWVKLLLGICCIWYGFAVYYTPYNLLGHPIESEPPNNSIIISAWVDEPSVFSKGGIYFWAMDYLSPKTKPVPIDPKELSKIKISEPLSYKIPYSREAHNKLIKAQQDQKAKKGALQYKHSNKNEGSRKKKGAAGDQLEYDSGFNILIPEELLKKDND